MSEDLIDWLRAQFDVDERVARAAQDLERDVFDGTGVIVMHAATGTRSVTLSSAVAIHIARHDPARVLREVEAKRKVIEFYEYAVAAWLLDRDKPNPPTVHLGEKAMAEAVLQALALPYSDRPGYQEEWRPQ